MTTQIFKRHERKYLINQETYHLLLKKLEPYTEFDEYSAKFGHYTVFNVYFDTIDDQFIRYSIDKPYYKEKVRIRSYTIPQSLDDSVFLEVKKKIGKTGNKRRIVLPLKDALDFIDGVSTPKMESVLDNQIVTEMAVLFNDYTLYPKTAISYHRVALFAKQDTSIRMTFDTKIFTSRENADLRMGHVGEDLLQDNMILWELKVGDSIPLWLTAILSELEIYPAKFSKYANEYKRYLTTERRKKYVK